MRDKWGGGVIISYAGVSITYYSTSHTLGFNSVANVNTVLDQLDSDYENYNTAYENQYPNYTALQLDSIDVVNNFDPLKTYEDFEAKFVGLTSERSVFENNETTWLNNNMTGPVPDSLDYTSDDAENTICNNNYNVIIAGTTYQWTSSGLVAGGGLNIAAQNNVSPAVLGCFTNYTSHHIFYSSDNTRKCYLKVAVLDCLIRGSAKTKVKSYHYTGGKWKRSRIYKTVNIKGTFYTSSCSQFISPNQSKGPKKREKLSVSYRVSSGHAYAETGSFIGSFTTDVSGLSSGSVTLGN